MEEEHPIRDTFLVLGAMFIAGALLVLAIAPVGYLINTAVKYVGPWLNWWFDFWLRCSTCGQL